jgi:hypothetical protein
MLGWQESYLDNSDHSLACCMPGGIKALAPGGAMASGSPPGNTGTRGVSARGAGVADPTSAAGATEAGMGCAFREEPDADGDDAGLVSVCPGALPQAMRFQLRRPRVPRVWDNQTAPAGFTRLSTPTHRLETGGGHHRVHVLTSCHLREVAVRYTGLGQSEHPASNLG